MPRHRRTGLALALLVILALVFPAAHPTLAQNGPLILCYRPTGSNSPADCDNLSDAGKQQSPPWQVTIATERDFSQFTLAGFALVALTRLSDTTLDDAAVKRLDDYVRGGGSLLLLDPRTGSRLDPSLIAPQQSIRTSFPSELTRAGRFTPEIGALTPSGLPPSGLSIVPIATLGDAWIPQSRAGFGEALNTTLASSLLGLGRVVLAPTGLPSIDYASTVGKWACCLLPNGPDMRVTAIEVTQAIQDLNNSVDLVAGKRTFVRVHVSSPQARSGVTATLTGRRGATTFTPALTPINPGGTITVKPLPDRGQLNDSFLFELPATWTNGTGSLQLTARLDPANAFGDPSRSNNVSTITVNLLPGPTMRLRIYNVRYTLGGSTYQAASLHLNALESWLRRAYPIANLDVSRRTYTYTSPGLPNVDVLNANMSVAWLLEIILGGMSPRTFFYGIVDDGGDFMRGKALGIPGTVSSGPTGTPGGSFGWDTDGSYGDWYGGHEIAHSLGRSHANFCGAGGGTAFPYPNGQISPSLSGNTAIYGFDIGNRAIYPPTWRDVMTYCNNQWVSDFTYEGIRSRFVAIGAALADAELQQGTFALITGRVELANGSGALGEIHVLDGSGAVTPTPGDWSIVLLNGGTQLASYPFTPAELDDEEDPSRPALFAEMVPWVGGTTRIELRRGTTVVDQRAVSASAPTVTVTAPAAGAPPAGPLTVRWTGADADGDALSYSVLFSTNNGATWRSLANGLSATELTVDPAGLPGGASCKFRVVASDGALSGQGDSAVVTIPDKAPAVTITAPANGATYFPAQPVAMEATAYDLEDGDMSGAALSWSSDRDGLLGTGNLLTTIGLSTGTHVITLTASDSAGNLTTATRTITVAGAEVAVTAQLDVAPAVVGAVASFGSAAQSTIVSTRTIGDGPDLSWTAQSDAPWVKLRVGGGAASASASGSTPADVELIVDPQGLPIGAYNATVTFTAGNATRTVPVNLIVEGTSVFMPLIRR